MDQIRFNQLAMNTDVSFEKGSLFAAGANLVWGMEIIYDLVTIRRLLHAGHLERRLTGENVRNFVRCDPLFSVDPRRIRRLSVAGDE